jgi:hypothetical protein
MKSTNNTHIPPATRQHNPFVVPKGYFESLPYKIMYKVKENSPTIATKAHRNKLPFLRIGVAAAIIGILSITSIIIYRQNISANQHGEMAQATPFQDIESSDELLDYAMLDNSDIEYYLTVAE